MADLHREQQASAPVEQRVKALESALADRGMQPAEFIDDYTKLLDEAWLPENGARVVAKAWADPEFRKRLLANGRDAVAELGLSMPAHHRHLVVLETGTRISSTVRAWCGNRVPCCARWASICRRKSRFACGIRLRTPATSYCPSGRRIPRDGPRTNSRRS